MRRLSCATVILYLVAALPTAALAAGFVYDCDLTDRRGSLGWVKPKTAIIMKSNGQVLVSDELILRYKGQPIPARVSRNTGRVLVVRWSLQGLVDIDKQRMPTMDYSARIDKKTGRIAVHGNPSDSPQKFVGRGSCKTRNQ